MLAGVKNALREHFGFDTFRPGQQAVIQALLSGASVAAVFPTGGGKSLCYQLPAVMLEGLTLVVSPLIALMKDQIDALARRSIKAARIDASLGPAELASVIEQIASGEIRILFVAPERFDNATFRRAIRGVRIALFAVDEAHCISEWGHNFRPDYLKLVRFARRHGAERMLALTATATPAVLDDICAQFGIARRHVFRLPFFRHNLQLLVSVVAAPERAAVLLERLRTRPPGATIVYVTTRRSSESLASHLAAEGLEALPYHAGMPPGRRAYVQDWFMGSQRHIVVATIAFGMGIDKPNIRYVYHHNIPKSLEGYAQQIGRAGRDGEPALCEVLACGSDLSRLESFAFGATPTLDEVRGLLVSLFRFISPGDRFDVSVAELSATHNIRVSVLRTLLAYLELDGYLEAGPPYPQGYRFIPREPPEHIVATFHGAQRRVVAQMFASASTSRGWLSFDVAAVRQGAAVTRACVVESMDQLERSGLVEMRPTAMRSVFVARRVPRRVVRLATSLHRRARRREKSQLVRLRQVTQLIAGNRCLPAALSEHFGEPITEPCGRCTWCLDGGSTGLPRPVVPRIPRTLRGRVAALQSEHPVTLGSPHALTKLLCGITTPHFARARLTRHPLFGHLAAIPFRRVIRWSRRQKPLPKSGKRALAVGHGDSGARAPPQTRTTVTPPRSRSISRCVDREMAATPWSFLCTRKGVAITQSGCVWSIWPASVRARAPSLERHSSCMAVSTSRRG